METLIDTLDPATRADLIAYLAPFVTAHKRQRIAEVLAQRTRHLTVVLENIYQPHNASAVVRSCECFGVQDVHAIELDNPFTPNKSIVRGASKWLSIHHYAQTDAGSGTAVCLQQLRRQGYRIAATTLRSGSIPIRELDVAQPVALCFGTEETGLSDEAHDLADLFVQIPMQGFTQSFNISVTAALCLYDLTTRLRPSALPWQLTTAEKQELTLAWYMGVVRQSDTLVQEFLARRAAPRRAVPDSAPETA